MVSCLNEAIVMEMFRSYRKQYREEHQIVGDNYDLDIHRRCAYTREHKLKAIDYVLNTWDWHPKTRVLVHISQYFAAKRLIISRTTLHRWLKQKQQIIKQKRGTRRLRLIKTPQQPEMAKKLHFEFEAAREIGRQISHRWFTR